MEDGGRHVPPKRRFITNPHVVTLHLEICDFHRVLQATFPSACSFIVLVFHCFTTCFGLQCHLQVCRIFYFYLHEGFCFVAFFFFPFFPRGHTLHVSICVSPPPCFPSLFLLFPCVCVCLLALTRLPLHDFHRFEHCHCYHVAITVI
jgi:hypothetical protein